MKTSDMENSMRKGSAGILVILFAVALIIIGFWSYLASHGGNLSFSTGISSSTTASDLPPYASNIHETDSISDSQLAQKIEEVSDGYVLNLPQQNITISAVAVSGAAFAGIITSSDGTKEVSLKPGDKLIVDGYAITLLNIAAGAGYVERGTMRSVPTLAGFFVIKKLP